jgi:biopolymer transport protein ExbD
MKKSMRAKRMQRHHKRNSGKSKLSLVSLMDIFTILVFFLMLNASDVQVLQVNDEVVLPESIATTPAKETLLLLVSNSQVILQGKLIANTSELLHESSDVIRTLIDELDYHTSRKSDVNDDAKSSQSITIMGDSSIEYSLLKRIMQSCAQAGYTNIALAVENKTDNGSAISSPNSAASAGVQR